MSGVTDSRTAIRHLKRSDPVLDLVIKAVGPCRFEPEKRPDVFRSVARAIIHQQLNGTAAGTIYRRFKGLYPRRRFPTPEDILATPLPRLRSAGLSPQKASYVVDLASKVQAGEVDLKAVRQMDDDEVVVELTKVKGVGRWTAAMVLMFTLGRPDILPVDDYGFRRGVQKAYGMRKVPSADRLERLARPWRPHRSVATWYIWQSVDIELAG